MPLERKTKPTKPAKAAAKKAAPSNATLPDIQISSGLVAAAQIGEQQTSDGYIDQLIIAIGATTDITDSWVDELHLLAAKDYESLWKGVSKTELSTLIAETIDRHKPKSITLLYPADTMVVNYDPDTDLFRKPKAIENQVVNVRTALQKFLESEMRKVQEVYFAYLKPHLLPQGRTVFDHQGKEHTSKKSMMEGLKGTQLNTDYLVRLKVTQIEEKKLEVHLGTANVERFYDVYGETAEIGSQQFVWKSALYYYNKIENRIIRLHHLDSENFLWVGDKTVKVIWKELNGDVLVRDVKPFSHSELRRIYGQGFLNDLDRVDGFTFWPDNKKFEQIREIKRSKHQFKYYNMYSPLLYQPSEGPVDVTMNYLQHVFPGNPNEPGNPHSLALDWLTLLYQRPRQMLPIIGLISKEQQTGKTTFMDWLRAWLGSNSANMGIESYLSKFNKHASFKLLVAIDEFEESALEKRTAKARFKKQATEKNSLVELKGIDQEEIPNFCKVVFATNSEKPLHLEHEDMNRFWVHQVHRLKPGQRDTKLMDKMVAEIPAMLHFLYHRKPLHENKSRSWFDPELFNTDYFKKIVGMTRPLYFDDVENYIRSIFLDFHVHTFRINPALILECMPKPKYALSEKQVKEVLLEHGHDKMDPKDNGVIEIPVQWDKVGANDYRLQYYHRRGAGKPYGRYYTLKASDWLTDDEMDMLAEPIESIWDRWDKQVGETAEVNTERQVPEWIN